MSIVKSIGDFFRSSHKDPNAKVDQYDILSPLMSVQEYANKSLELISLVNSNELVQGLLKGTVTTDNKNKVAAVKAYKDFLDGLPYSYRSYDNESLKGLVDVSQSIIKNLDLVEKFFPQLFDLKNSNIDEANIKTSSLVVIGYLEQANEFFNWTSSFIRHLTDDDNEMIPPFETKSLILKASKMGQFGGFNLTNWNGSTDSIINDIRHMQKKGVDVAIKSGDTWLDAFMNDNQFSPSEADLMTAALSNPIMMVVRANMSYHKWLMDLRTSRRDWLVAKIALETKKMRGLDRTTPEYKKLEKATEHYADLISKYEQRIARARA
jgi:hypothetical protein